MRFCASRAQARVNLLQPLQRATIATSVGDSEIAIRANRLYPLLIIIKYTEESGTPSDGPGVEAGRRQLAVYVGDIITNAADRHRIPSLIINRWQASIANLRALNSSAAT